MADQQEQVKEEIEKIQRQLGADGRLPDEVLEGLRKALLDSARTYLETAAPEKVTAPPAPREEIVEVERFTLLMRIQHMILVVSCVLLIITGLPLKFVDSGVAFLARGSDVFFGLTGGVNVSGVVHRVGAAGLIAVGVFHMLYLAAFKEGRENFRELIPSLRDVKNVVENVKYFLGMQDKGARFSKFSYVEKFDYWAVYWGMVIMIATGWMLWFETQTLNLFPMSVLYMAREAHSDEALLATLAIIVWHFYNTHLNPHKFPMNPSWLTGKITLEEMIEEHPLQYEQMVAEGKLPPREDVAGRDG